MHHYLDMGAVLLNSYIKLVAKIDCGKLLFVTWWLLLLHPTACTVLKWKWFVILDILWVEKHWFKVRASATVYRWANYFRRLITAKINIFVIFCVPVLEFFAAHVVLYGSTSSGRSKLLYRHLLAAYLEQYLQVNYRWQQGGSPRDGQRYGWDSS